MPQPLDPECIFQVLAEHEVDYVLIGGLAAVLHGSPTLTNDADILPAQTEDNLTRLGAALRDLEAKVRSPDTPDGIPFEPHPELLRSMAMLNMTTRCGDLDLSFAPAAMDDYEEVAERAVTYDISGTRVLVASLDDVIRSKETAGRPKDEITLPTLRALREEIERHE